FLIYLSLSTARWPALPKVQAADSRHLAFSLARVSDHVRRRLDQIARRPLLARSHLSLLPLRDAADPKSHQPLSAFCPALVPQIRSDLESLRGADRALVFFRSPNRAPRCGRAAGHIPDFSHHQRQSFVSQLSHDHSVSGVL